jgi:hypothetical protein
VAQFRYLGTTATNQIWIQEQIKRKFNSGNACCRSVHNLLSSRLLSKTVKIKTLETLILRIVLYGCDTWSLTLREVYRPMVFEVLRRIFGPKKEGIS